MDEGGVVWTGCAQTLRQFRNSPQLKSYVASSQLSKSLFGKLFGENEVPNILRVQQYNSVSTTTLQKQLQVLRSSFPVYLCPLHPPTHAWMAIKQTATTGAEWLRKWWIWKPALLLTSWFTNITQIAELLNGGTQSIVRALTELSFRHRPFCFFALSSGSHLYA